MGRSDQEYGLDFDHLDSAVRMSAYFVRKRWIALLPGKSDSRYASVLVIGRTASSSTILSATALKSKRLKAFAAVPSVLVINDKTLVALFILQFLVRLVCELRSRRAIVTIVKMLRMQCPTWRRFLPTIFPRHTLQMLVVLDDA
jgi:hypothetical protein